MPVKVGIIGGTGLEDPHLFDVEAVEKPAVTPWGEPSDTLTCGTIADVDVVILPRHDRKHGRIPSNINYRANIHALRMEGCTHIIAGTAVGSLKPGIKPMDFVVLDQFIDRTTKRHSTFYDAGDGACHLSMAEPFCPSLRAITVSSLETLRMRHHSLGTVVTIEGPRFSTKAESRLFQSWGCDVVGMTQVPEATLAREAGMCYVSIAMVTDYDCWHETEEVVSVDVVNRTLRANAENAKRLFLDIIPRITDAPCGCHAAYKTSLMGDVASHPYH